MANRPQTCIMRKGVVLSSTESCPVLIRTCRSMVVDHLQRARLQLRYHTPQTRPGWSTTPKNGSHIRCFYSEFLLRADNYVCLQEEEERGDEERGEVVRRRQTRRRCHTEKESVVNRSKMPAGVTVFETKRRVPLSSSQHPNRHENGC